MTARPDLLDLAIRAAGGDMLWQNVSELRVDIVIGGPIWAGKGWPPGQVFDQIVTVDPVREHVVFTPFTRPDQRMVFDAATDAVSIQTLDGEVIEKLHPTRSSFDGMERFSPWDAVHLGYFLGYGCWNYFTAPFLLTYPGVAATEIEQWHEGAETWRRLAITFPPSIVTHSTNQVFYYDAAGLLRRMDYVAEVNGAAPVGQYNSGHREFAGLTFPTRRRIHRRDPDNTCDMTYSAITLDVRDVEVDFLRRP